MENRSILPVSLDLHLLKPMQEVNHRPAHSKKHNYQADDQYPGQGRRRRILIII